MGASDAVDIARFEHEMLPHLDAAYTLARYLTRNVQDAEDAVQEAMLRALRYFHTFRGEGARAWLLSIVRRVCFTQYEDGQHYKHAISLDTAEPMTHGTMISLIDEHARPDLQLWQTILSEQVFAAVNQLPPALREALLLREIEQCSYQEIAMITQVPVGTVMSRLSRARVKLAALLRDVVDAGDVG